MKKHIKLSSLILLIGIVFSFTNNITAQPNYPKDPQHAELVYSDLENFNEAYAHLKAGSDTIHILNVFYFEKASIGLQEYILRHNLTPEMLKDAIRKNPTKYDKISSFIEDIDTFKPKYINTMKKFKKEIPNAVFPPTYLLVGANRGIGQASKFGQLVTVIRVLDDEAIFFKLIVHELSHFQQAMAMGIQTYAALYSSSENMLGICLREGGAEFITGLVLQDITQAKGLQYLNKNEKKLIDKFEKDLLTQDKNFWLWKSIDQDKVPKLLGYAIGYKICKTFYEKSKDKNVALRAILKMTNPEDFLRESGYLSN